MGDWLERGGPPEPIIVRVLAYYLGVEYDTVGATLDDHARAIRGLVDAGATEVQLAGYLKCVETDSTLPPPTHGRRAAAVSLWHIVRAAWFRDQFNALRERWRIEHPEAQPPLAEWLAARILEAPDDSDDREPAA